MSNPEPDPQETVCRTGLRDGVVERPGRHGPVELLEPRTVPLGGPRGMTVERVLPQKARSLIGAWCFLDAYGPDDVAATGGMRVPRHPHTGLATVSWLFEGRIDHVDSAGNWATVRPGDVDLMNAGRGITHQEFSTADTTVLHGVQLWYAFPEAHRFDPPSLDTHRPEPVEGPGWTARVFLGSLLGSVSPVATRIPLVGAQLDLRPGTRLQLDADPTHEHGLLVVQGEALLDGVRVPRGTLAYTPPGRSPLVVEAGQEPLLAVLIGGQPLEERIVMWWNFVGRSHEEIARWRGVYQQEMGFEAPEPGPRCTTPRARARARSRWARRSRETSWTRRSAAPMTTSNPSRSRCSGSSHPGSRTRCPPRSCRALACGCADEPRFAPPHPLMGSHRRPRRRAPAMTEQPTLENPQVRRTQDRFEILVAPEGEPAGFTVYLDHDAEDGEPVRIFPHTVVREEYGGRGLASILVREALDATIGEGRRIVAVCPYIKAWLPKHPEYARHSVPARPEHLALLRR